MAVITEAADCKRLYVEVAADPCDVLPQARLNVGGNQSLALFGAEDYVHADLNVVVCHGEGL